MKTVSYAVIIVATALLAIGAAWTIQQHTVISRSVPVKARIESSEVVRRSNGKRGSYKPQVTFSFRYGGGTGKEWHAGDRVTYFNSSSTQAWANEIVGRFPKGAEVGVWVDPVTECSFLLREHEFMPYVPLILAAALGMIGLLRLAGVGDATGYADGSRTRMRAVLLGEMGSLLLPLAGLRGKLRGAVAASILWTGIGIIGLGHYAWVAERILLGTRITLGVYAGITLVPVALAWRYWSLLSHLSEPRVMVQPAPAEMGEPLAVTVDFHAYRPLSVRKVTVDLECIEHYRERARGKTESGTRVIVTRSATAARAQQVAPGETVTGSTELKLPVEEPATTLETQRQCPWYHWQLVVTVTLKGMPDYIAAYPLRVEAGRAEPVVKRAVQ